jgi:putative endonuclease
LFRKPFIDILLHRSAEVAEFPPKAGKGRLGRRRRPRWTLMEFVYVLCSEKDGKLYIGLTNNIARRLEEHNSGCVPATKGRRPLKIIHLEKYLDRKQAAEREKFLKSGQGRELLKVLNKT